MSFKNWCFTSYQETLEPDLTQINYLTYGKETCPTTGKKHLQGYVEFKNKIRITGAKKILKDNAIHLEKRDGTQQQAIDYCSKEDKNPYVYGTPSVQGKRNDLKTELQECKTFKEFKSKNPDTTVRYRRGIKAHYDDKLKANIPDWRPVKVITYYGPSRTLKTKRAVDACNGDYFKLNRTSQSQVWFDDYEGQSNLIIDDFSGWIPYRMLLTMLDGYKMNLPVKGGFVPAQYTTVYITSNKSPSQWYSKLNDEMLEPLMNRLKENGGQIIDTTPPRVPDMFSDSEPFRSRSRSRSRTRKIRSPDITVPNDFTIPTPQISD